MTNLKLNGKRILVCGGAGFMGSNFIRYILENFPAAKVANLDLLTYAGNVENLKGVDSSRYTFTRGDICDTEPVRKLMSAADYVVNFAAETHVDRSIHGEADAFVRTNVLGAHSLLKALRSSPNVLKMVHVSTDEVWGDLPLKSKNKFNEKSPFQPNSPYAASKAAGDLLIRSYARTYGVPVVVSHSVNNFGPRQYPEKLIPFFTLRAMKNEPLPLYGDGLNRRDWIHVDDHSAAIVALLFFGEAGGVYGISAGDERANIEIAKQILKILKKPEKLITFVSDRPGHDRRYAVDSSRLRKLGWKPRHSLEKDLPATVEWYKSNVDWIKKVENKRASINSHIVV